MKKFNSILGLITIAAMFIGIVLINAYVLLSAVASAAILFVTVNIEVRNER